MRIEYLFVYLNKQVRETDREPAPQTVDFCTYLLNQLNKSIMQNLINLLERNVTNLFTILVLILMSNLIVLMIVGTVTTFVISYLVVTSLLVFSTVLIGSIVYTFKK